jgi:ATP-dependent DNA ligase
VGDSRVNRLRGPRYNPPRSRQCRYEKCSRALSPKQYLNLTGTIAQLYLVRMQRTLPAGFITPCLPTKTDKLPSGSQWLHKIKHDGFRIMAGKDGPRVRLYSRAGNDLTRHSR